MVQRHRYAYPVVHGQAQRLADEKPVIDHIMVREGRSLGRPGGTAGELDIDGVVKLEAFGRLLEMKGAESSTEVSVERVGELPVDPVTGKYRLVVL